MYRVLGRAGCRAFGGSKVSRMYIAGETDLTER